MRLRTPCYGRCLAAFTAVATIRRLYAAAVSAVAALGASSLALAAPPPPPEPPAQIQPEEKNTGDDLARKLLRKAQSSGDEDVMEQIMRLMDEAAANMDVKLNPGPATQQLHQDILAKLDEAIREAASRRRPSVPPNSKPHQDKRRRGGERDRQRQREKQSAMDKQAGRTGEEDGQPQGLMAKPIELPDGELLDVRRAWGHLPVREREEIIQGVNEEFLEKYREWVERYYKALQESSSEPR